ncbi:hypothetical protein D3C85_977860 [compost metagenome]
MLSRPDAKKGAPSGGVPLHSWLLLGCKRADDGLDEPTLAPHKTLDDMEHRISTYQFCTSALS